MLLLPLWSVQGAGLWRDYSRRDAEEGPYTCTYINILSPAFFWLPLLCPVTTWLGQELLLVPLLMLNSAIFIHRIPEYVCSAILLGEVQVLILSIVWTNTLLLMLLQGVRWGVALEAFLWYQQKNFLFNWTFRCSCFLHRSLFSWYLVCWKLASNCDLKQ